MNTLTYLSNDHQKFFETQLDRYNVFGYDCERIALFYVLGLSETLRTHIDELYDEGGIHLQATQLEFQTSGTRALTRFAFVLYNNFREPSREDENIFCSPSLLDIFCSVDRELIPFMYQAISIRLGLISIM